MFPERAAERPVGSRVSSRRTALERAALDTAKAWAGSRMNALRAEGREVAGGWPGTLSEARHFVRAQLARNGLSLVTHDELEQAARATYATARSTWLANAESEDDSTREPEGVDERPIA
jgi:hypothetical protein